MISANVKRLLPILLFSCCISYGCKKSKDTTGTPYVPPVVVPPVVVPPTGPSDVTAWLTTGNRLSLLAKQTNTLVFGTTANTNNDIAVDSSIAYQTMDGFGYTLTQGSAIVINQLPATAKAALLTELFGNAENSIGVSYLRISIGASDLSSSVYTYNDLPAGSTDVNQDQFSLTPDMGDVIPLLKEIIAINPSIKILGSPWTPPVWMKSNGNSKGGSLLPAYYSAYAKYFVKYIQAMKAQGITIDAITIQNEPENPDNNPSMVMTAQQQAEFIKTNLGPAFAAASITTKIILFDHNCDHPQYPIAVLGDAGAYPYIDGSAFHLYAGDVSALTTVHNAYPDKNVYFTEQWTSSAGDFAGDLKWHLKNVVIGSSRNWSKVVLEWNMANDAGFGPHTPGGCTQCLGGLTITGSSINRNVAYYIIGHAAKFVPAGSKRIASSQSGTLNNVAFLRPDGKKVLIVENDATSSQTFNLRYKNKWVAITLDGGAVATYVW